MKRELSRVQRGIRRVALKVKSGFLGHTLDAAGVRHAMHRFVELQERAVDTAVRYKARQYEGHAASLLAKEKAAEKMRVRLLKDDQPVDAQQAALQKHVAPQQQPTGERGTLLDPFVQALSEKLICPLTKRMLHDPVIASDGWTYERKAIEVYMQTSDCSPVTGQVLHSKLTTNVTVQWALTYVRELQM